jgi:hypothetical protein
MATTKQIADALALADLNGNRAQRTLADLASKRNRYGMLSDKQVTYALSIAEQLRNPEPHVAAPLGKVSFCGVIVSVKERSGFRGAPILKMTVKVETADGSWIAWGTFPESLRDSEDLTAYKGRAVEIKATLKSTDGPDSAPHFVLMHRPTASYLPDAADTIRMACEV